MAKKGTKQSTEWIQRRVTSRKGYRPSEENRRRMSLTKMGTNNPFYGKHWTESHRERFMKANAGLRHSEETKKKLSTIRIKFYQDHPEVVEQYKGQNNPMFGEKGVLNPMFGKHLSQETRLKLSNVAIDRYSDEKNPFYGKHHSIETREKMKELWKHRAFPEKDNKLELKLQAALADKGVIFKKHANVLGRPDLFLEPDICIFIDGCYWHGCPCKFDQTWTNPHAVYIKSRMGHDVTVTHELIKVDL